MSSFFIKSFVPRRKKSIAEQEKSTWTIIEMVEAVQSLPVFKEPGVLEKTLELLRRHDVILEEKGGLRIASELTRRWISLQKTNH